MLGSGDDCTTGDGNWRLKDESRKNMDIDLLLGCQAQEFEEMFHIQYWIEY